MTKEQVDALLAYVDERAKFEVQLEVKGELSEESLQYARQHVYDVLIAADTRP